MSALGRCRARARGHWPPGAKPEGLRFGAGLWAVAARWPDRRNRPDACRHVGYLRFTGFPCRRRMERPGDGVWRRGGAPYAIDAGCLAAAYGNFAAVWPGITAAAPADRQKINAARPCFWACRSCGRYI